MMTLGREYWNLGRSWEGCRLDLVWIRFFFPDASVR